MSPFFKKVADDVGKESQTGWRPFGEKAGLSDTKNPVRNEVQNREVESSNPERGRVERKRFHLRFERKKTREVKRPRRA